MRSNTKRRTVPQTLEITFCREREFFISPQLEYRATVIALLLPAWFAGVQSGTIMYITLSRGMASGRELRFEVSGSLPDGEAVCVVKSGISAALMFEPGLPGYADNLPDPLPVWEEPNAKIAANAARQSGDEVPLLGKDFTDFVLTNAAVLSGETSAGLRFDGAGCGSAKISTQKVLWTRR
jgi:hypothetical protein